MTDHSCDKCGKRVLFPLWYMQRVKRDKPMCATHIAKEKLRELKDK